MFSIYITIIFISRYYVVSYISFIFPYIFTGWIGIFCFKYLLSFILLVFWFRRSGSISEICFLFQINFTKNIPLYTDSQLIRQCKLFFVTVTMDVNSPEPTLVCVITLCVWLSSLYHQYFPSVNFVVVVVFFVVFIVIGNCLSGRGGLVLIPPSNIIFLVSGRNGCWWIVLGATFSFVLLLFFWSRSYYGNAFLEGMGRS